MYIILAGKRVFHNRTDTSLTSIMNLAWYGFSKMYVNVCSVIVLNGLKLREKDTQKCIIFHVTWNRSDDVFGDSF